MFAQSSAAVLGPHVPCWWSGSEEGAQSLPGGRNCHLSWLSWAPCSVAVGGPGAESPSRTQSLAGFCICPFVMALLSLASPGAVPMPLGPCRRTPSHAPSACWRWGPVPMLRTQGRGTLRKGPPPCLPKALSDPPHVFKRHQSDEEHVRIQGQRVTALFIPPTGRDRLWFQPTLLAVGTQRPCRPRQGLRPGASWCLEEEEKEGVHAAS